MLHLFPLLHRISNIYIYTYTYTNESRRKIVIRKRVSENEEDDRGQQKADRTNICCILTKISF